MPHTRNVLLLVLLAAAAAHAGPFLRRPPGPPPAVARAWSKLDATVPTFVVDDVPLVAACAEAARLTGVPVRIDAGALRAAGVDPDNNRGTVRLHNLRGWKLLNLTTGAFSPSDRTRLGYWVSDDGAVVVTTAAGMRRQVVVAAYDCSTLLARARSVGPPTDGEPTDRQREEELCLLVRETVAPDSWRDVDPSKAGWAGLVGDQLWVVQDPESQNATAALVVQLHEQYPGGPVYPNEAADRLARPSGRGWLPRWR